MHALEAKQDTKRKSVAVEWWAVQDIRLGPLGESHAIVMQRRLSIIQYDTQRGTAVKTELKLSLGPQGNGYSKRNCKCILRHQS